MTARTKTVGLAVAAVAVVGAAAGFAVAAGDDDEPLRGEVRGRAAAAALEHAGGGTVVETEVGDDGAAYEVEVRRPDGTQIEVQLDDAFDVVGTERDDDGSDDDGPDDD